MKTHAHQKAIDLAKLTIRKAVPSAVESIKWNSPSFATTEHFATFFLRAKKGFQVVLHRGAKARPGAAIREHIRDPAGLLEWRGGDRAIITFLDEKDVAAKADHFANVVKQWATFV